MRKKSPTIPINKDSTPLFHIIKLVWQLQYTTVQKRNQWDNKKPPSKNGGFSYIRQTVSWAYGQCCSHRRYAVCNYLLEFLHWRFTAFYIVRNAHIVGYCGGVIAYRLIFWVLSYKMLHQISTKITPRLTTNLFDKLELAYSLLTIFFCQDIVPHFGQRIYLVLPICIAIFMAL